MAVESQPGWTIHPDNEPEPGVATFPETPDEPLHAPCRRSTPYVLLKTKEKKWLLKVGIREGAHGSQIHIPPHTFGTTQKDDAPEEGGIECEIKPLTKTQYWIRFLSSTAQGLVSLMALIIGLAGIVIDGSLKVGARMDDPYIISASRHTFLLGLASVLQFVGLVLAFARAVMRDDV